MKLTYSRLLILFFGLIISPGCKESEQKQTAPPALSSMDADFWKDQAIEDMIVPWTQQGMHAQDSLFPAYLDRQWQSFRNDHLYPGMLARHVFSYSTAYLLTGEDRYLDIATRVAQYVIQQGWDQENGLWFNELDGASNPVDTNKDLFMQLYAVTGLSMYFVVTRNEEILHYIQNSIELLNQHAWDRENGGYYNVLDRNLSVIDDEKKATPQLAPLSGYLAYLYPATRNEAYLEEMERGLEVLLTHMMDPHQGWLLESFDKSWQLNPESSERISVGHNIEIVWMSLRLYLLTGKEKYKSRALDLYPRLYRTAFHEKTGAWRHSFRRTDPEDSPDSTPWWIQAYGNMLELYLYRITGDRRHLDRFRAGADFWNDHFVDKEYGGAFLSAYLNGEVKNGHKAVRSKTSYHSLEHGLLNFLYLKLWVEGEPVTLHFRINRSEEGDAFYPSIIEDPDLALRSVRVAGKGWQQYDGESGAVTLPALQEGSVEVDLSVAD